MSETAIQTQHSAEIAEFNPNVMGQLWKLAETFARSTMVPKDYIGKPENCFVAMQHGNKLGLDPLASLQSIANINGKPSLYGDVGLALVKVHADFEDIRETWPDPETAVCELKRRGKTPVVRQFTAEMAKKAGLWNKAGPWTQYPQRMLQMRARTWAIRDCFPDALHGLGFVEEQRDIVIQTEAKVTSTKGLAGLKEAVIPETPVSTEPAGDPADEAPQPPFDDPDIAPELVNAEVVPLQDGPEQAQATALDRKALITEVYKLGRGLIQAKNREEFWEKASGEDFLGREVAKVQQVTTEELQLLLEMFTGGSPCG